MFRKLILGVLNSSVTNPPQKNSRRLKFQIKEEGDHIIWVAKTKALISCAVILICVFVFANVKQMVFIAQDLLTRDMYPYFCLFHSFKTRIRDHVGMDR